ncbi:META domain-containing protein [Streptomyces venezuelae]|nr:META domain-containing protein [Streptomyces venezuelae]
MRTSRRVPLALSLAAVLALTACGGTQAAGSVADVKLTGTSWSVQSLTAGGKTLTGPPQAAVAFEENGTKATGNYGCNTFGADLVIDGTAVTVTPGATTAMACDAMDFENAFARLFKGRLEIGRQDGRLTLTAPGGDRIELADAPTAAPAALTGSRWVVDSLVRGETVSSVPAGAEGRAEFTIAADGSASGSLGCNRFTGKAVIDGPRVTFGPLAATRMACTGPAGEVEKALSALFASGPLHYTVKDRTLTLTGADGAGIRASIQEK